MCDNTHVIFNTSLYLISCWYKNNLLYHANKTWDSESYLC